MSCEAHTATVVVLAKLGLALAGVGSKPRVVKSAVSSWPPRAWVRSSSPTTVDGVAPVMGGPKVPKVDKLSWPALAASDGMAPAGSRSHRRSVA